MQTSLFGGLPPIDKAGRFLAVRITRKVSAMTDEGRVFVLVKDHFTGGDIKAAISWMRSPNRLLNYRSPKDLIEAGRPEEVLELVRLAIEKCWPIK